MGGKTILTSNLLIIFGIFAIMICVIGVLYSQHTIDACIILQLDKYVESEFVKCMDGIIQTQNNYAIVGVLGLFMLVCGLLLHRF